MHEKEIYCPGDAGSIIANADRLDYITVTRNSTNINGRLPFVLYGTNFKDSTFKTILADLTNQYAAGNNNISLAGSLTISVSVDANGALVFTYVSGINTDTITINSKGISAYREKMQSLHDDDYILKGINYSSGNAGTFILSAQLGNDILTEHNNGRGVEQDWIRPNACRQTWDVNTNRVFMQMKKNVHFNKFFAMALAFEKEVNTLEFDFCLNHVPKKDKI